LLLLFQINRGVGAFLDGGVALDVVGDGFGDLAFRVDDSLDLGR